MRPAPIVLFAFNRPDHLARTLSALARNALASESDLSIHCDGPRSEEERVRVEEVRKVARAARGFRTLRVVEQDTNRGLARSVVAGVTELLQGSASVIVVEDDLETSPDFLRFINQGLETYQHEPRVFSVTGFTPPLAAPEGYAWDAYPWWRCSSWGWGTWRDRWQKFDRTGPPVDAQRVARGGRDLPRLLELQGAGKIDSWAVFWCLAHARHDAVCIYPVVTLVKNIGLDKSGRHAGPDVRLEVDLALPQGGVFEFPLGLDVLPVFDAQRRRFHAPGPADRARMAFMRLFGRRPRASPPRRPR